MQHLIDLPDGVGAFVHDCGIPYAVTLHDFFYACPRVTLLDSGGGYCGMPPVDKCTACIRQNGSHANLHPSLTDAAQTGATWRAKWDKLLRGAWQVIAPSRDTAARYAALFPGLTCEVRPHFGPPAEPEPLRLPPAAPLAVAVLGAIGPQKGARQLVELARHCSRWDDDIGFVVIGHTDRDKELEKFDNIRISGSYAPGSALAALRQSGCRVALFLSIFPETYSYTLSEALAAGLAPVAYDFGAIGERLRDLGAGVLVPLLAPPEQVALAIRQAARIEQPVPAAAIDGRYNTLMREYYIPALTDLAESMPPPDQPRLLAWPEGTDRDNWCGDTVHLRLWSREPVARLMLSFWMPPSAALQGVEISCGNRVLARAFLDAGQIGRVVAPLAATDACFLDITCRFDFTFPLEPPDVRARAAVLSGIEISHGAGWLAVEMPSAPG